MILSAVRVLPITCVNAQLEYLVLITEHISCRINFDLRDFHTSLHKQFHWRYLGILLSNNVNNF